MKIITNPLDAVRLDYITELADMLAARAVALRLAAVAGDVDGIDASFTAIRLIGRDIAVTRREIETIETRNDSDAKEAA